MAPVPMSLQVITYNTHLFGGVARFGNTQTCLYHRDEERADEIARQIRGTGADIVGLTEIWDPILAARIQAQIEDLYPFAASALPTCTVLDHLEALKRRLPRLAAPVIHQTEAVVSFFARNHYRTDRGVLSLILPENWLAGLVADSFSIPDIMGAGLIIFSKHLIEHSEFLPHPEQADTDRFARKGVLKAKILPPDAQPVCVLLTHLQEGVRSRLAQRVRQLQILRLLETASLESHAIIMGDMNIDQRSSEFSWVMGLLEEQGFRDAFSSANPDAPAENRFTFVGENPLTRTLLGGPEPQGDATLDYIWLRNRLKVLGCRVLRWLDSSDHLPVQAEVAVSTVAS